MQSIVTAKRTTYMYDCSYRNYAIVSAGRPSVQKGNYGTGLGKKFLGMGCDLASFLQRRLNLNRSVLKCVPKQLITANKSVHTSGLSGCSKLND